MKIFPAIDIKNKKCVRLLKGDFNNETIYVQSPFEQASRYKEVGLTNLHIVDLDGALSGEPVNFETVNKIVKELKIRVEIGGGIRSLKNIDTYLNLGVDKVILGSAAIKDPSFLEEACKKFNGKIALGIDAKKGLIAVSGWKESTNIFAENFLKEVNEFGFSRIIHTDIERDGTKTRPNIEESLKLAKISKAPLVISGGIASIEDVKKIKTLEKFNIEGVIIGKAIYDGDIKLNELSEIENAKK
jgi:phosphoribosylformimino-5-aminoimidazole carboxamide ribotide isomerase